MSQQYTKFSFSAKKGQVPSYDIQGEPELLLQKNMVDIEC